MYSDGEDRIPQQPLKMTKEKRTLIKMSEECGMKDVFRVLHPVKVDFTRFDNINQIYVSSNILPLEYNAKLLINSDHFTLLQLSKSERKCYWKMKISCLKDPNTILDLKKEINMIKGLSILTDSDICL